MAKKKVIAHFMHEHEQAEAEQTLANPEVTGSYVVGEIEESDIPALEQKGLLVETLDEQPGAEETPGADRELRTLPPVPHTAAEPMAGAMPQDVEIDQAGPNFYLVALPGPLLEQWRADLEQLGVALLERIPPSSYTAHLTPEQAHSVAGLPFVSRLRVYRPEDTGPVEVSASIGEPFPPLAGPEPTRPRAIHAYDVRLHREEDMNVVLQWLAEQRIEVAGSGGRKIRVYVLEDSDAVERISTVPEVAEVVEFIPPTLTNDVARQLLGIDDGANPGAGIPQEGEGEIVGVADTGLDQTHPDFQGRIVGVVALGRLNDSSDPHGHGTHVAGSVLGDGSASNGSIRGAAPKARLFFQSLLDARNGLGGLPVDLSELFEEAYQAGARIHNNSWGSATPAVYTLSSEEVDDFVARRKDMLIVISAGNEAQAATRVHSQQGFPDWLSVGSPASCKNALTVGASRSSRVAGGIAHLTWGDALPDEFPDPWIAAQKTSGDPEALAAFSSRGPIDDHRIKPDVVAPGTNIASAKSSRAPLRRFWGPYPGDGRYAYMGGTSMAAPLVSGCAALVREYYVKDRAHQPSAALLKATLVNSTRWLTGLDSVADFDKPPNFNQGFGCVHMPSAIPNQSRPALRLEFVDSWQDQALHFAQTGQRFRWRIAVAGGEPLRICLAWTDAPGRGLQNNLDLVVEDPAQQKHVGNTDLPRRLGLFDPENNVEMVRFDAPAAGDYTIQCFAYNLLRPPQDFALVVTGALTPPLNRDV